MAEEERSHRDDRVGTLAPGRDRGHESRRLDRQTRQLVADRPRMDRHQACREERRPPTCLASDARVRKSRGSGRRLRRAWLLRRASGTCRATLGQGPGRRGIHCRHVGRLCLGSHRETLSASHSRSVAGRSRYEGAGTNEAPSTSLGLLLRLCQWQIRSALLRWHPASSREGRKSSRRSGP